MKFTKALFMLAVSLSGVATAKKTSSTDTVTAEFLGASGQMKLYPVDSPDVYMQIKQAKLQEVKADGSKVSGKNKSLNVAGKNEWSDFEVVSDNGRKVSSTTFTVLDSDPVSFALTAHFAEVTSTITEVVPCSGNVTANTTCTEDITVKENELKFSIQVSGWTFSETTNKLMYGLAISTKSKSGNSTVELTDTSGDSETFASDAGTLVVPTTATIKGGEEDQDVEVDVSLDTEGDKQIVTFIFPSFPEGTTLYYDPDVAVNTATNDNDDKTTSSATSLGASVVGMAILSAYHTLY